MQACEQGARVRWLWCSEAGSAAGANAATETVQRGGGRGGGAGRSGTTRRSIAGRMPQPTATSLVVALNAEPLARTNGAPSGSTA